MRPYHSKGFTLVELMVAVAVLAILAAVALPSFRDMVQRSRVKGAADAAIALVGEARTGAVKASRDVNVSLTGAGSTWCIGANAAPDPTTAGDPYVALATTDTCDCTSSTACMVGVDRLVVNGADHANVAVSNTGAIIFDGKLGLQRATDLDTDGDGVEDSALSVRTLADFASPDGRYFLRVQVSPGGMPSACVPSGLSIPGYSSC